MELMERYRKAVEDLLAKVRDTQTERIIEAGRMIAESVASGGKIYLSGICHSIEMDLISRGGGPLFYKHFDNNLDSLKAGDVLVVSSVSGRTKPVVDLTVAAVEKGVKVIAFTSMEYAVQVDPVHESGKKLYDLATMYLDNCAPAAEAMLEVEGIEARFAAASGIASDYIMWNVTAVAVETLMKEKGITPGIFKSANFPGGADYNNNILTPHYEKYGW